MSADNKTADPQPVTEPEYDPLPSDTEQIQPVYTVPSDLDEPEPQRVLKRPIDMSDNSDSEDEAEEGENEMNSDDDHDDGDGHAVAPKSNAKAKGKSKSKSKGLRNVSVEELKKQICPHRKSSATKRKAATPKTNAPKRAKTNKALPELDMAKAVMDEDVPMQGPTRVAALRLVVASEPVSAKSVLDTSFLMMKDLQKPTLSEDNIGYTKALDLLKAVLGTVTVAVAE